MVRVGPFRFTVSRVEQFHAVEDLDGLTDKPAQQILLRDRLGADVERQTLLHEVLHACWYATALEATATEEDAVSRLSLVLIDVLRRNPKLVAYLVEEA